ncbi:hypothetical protein ACK3SF_04520 [Candidatus Nanosalina sp. VS9-1]|uniref:hypothetical protein n=1 Tax=Candidatus Nanosalina sp. VS9-1 TaxID=3388566 RepID=UPI0039E1F005
MEVAVDANVVIHGRRSNSFEKAYTVPEIFAELESKEAQRKADTMDLKPREPTEKSLKLVEETSEKINSPTSHEDEKLAALAHSRELTLVTDDKALQNLAEILDIDYTSYMDEEIEEALEWELVCGNCGKEISSQPCPRCGSEMIQRKARSYN